MTNNDHDLKIPLCFSCQSPTALSKKTGKPNKFCSTRCVKHGELRVIHCSQCQKQFQGHRETACSRECQIKARTNNKPQIIQCSWCKKEMVRQPAVIKTNNFCSPECSHTFLRGGQEKFIKKECRNCKKEFELKYIDREQQFCSYHCSNSGEFSNFYGPDGTRRTGDPWTKGLTADTDERLAELGKKISATAKAQYASGERSVAGENNPNFGKTIADRTPEQLENYSKAAVKRCMDGYGGDKTYKQGKYFSTKIDKEMYFKSSWEERCMKCFDLDQNIIYFEYEKLSIKYKDGKRYIPDFIVFYKDGSKKMIEIKPKKFLLRENVILKQKAGEEYCSERGWKYQFYTLEDIIEHEKILGISS